jgi:hypothetical protein
MRKIRKFGTALAVAAFVATGMMASSARLYAAGPGGGNSQTVLCALLAKAMANTTTLFGADSDVVKSLQAQYDANCVVPTQ